jgi:hypothetical protein
MEGINQFGIQYIYTWKCHKKSLCINILNKSKCLFSKAEDRKAKQVLSEDWYQWEDIGKGFRWVITAEICTHV